MSQSKPDIYQEVTQLIIDELEKGVAPWVKPWKNNPNAKQFGTIPLRHDGSPYQGINILILWVLASIYGYQQPYWMTYKQAKQLKGCVRKGEKASRIIFYKPLEVKKDQSEVISGSESGYDDTKIIPMIKQYAVFNVAQIDGLPDHYYQTSETHTETLLPEHRVKPFINGLNATIEHGFNKAGFYPIFDKIIMPAPSQFVDIENYYATLLHELTHWTGAKKRLGRNLANRFGSQAYAAEELIAELGAAFLGAYFNIEGQLQHASYIKSWLKLLKEDKKAIFTASAKAQQAVDYLMTQCQAQNLAA